MTLDGRTAERAGDLLAAARQAGCGGVVCYSSGRHFLTDADPVWWLTRFKPLADSVALVLPDGAVELWISPCWDLPRARAQAPGACVRAGSLRDALASYRERTGVSNQAVAFWGRTKLTGRTESLVAGALGGATFLDEQCEQVSRRRTADDIAALEQVSALAVAGHHELLRVARPGIAEFEIAAAVQERLRLLGAGDTFMLLSSSLHNLALHPPTERVLAAGDVLLIELSPSLHGAYTQICRTVVIGVPATRLRQDFEVLTAALRAGAAACLPGTAVRAIVAAMNSVIAEAGFADYCRPPYMRARGHGLGLSSSMPGDLTADSDAVLAEGDVFVLHPNQYLPSSGYLLCGEPLVVTAAGGRSLTGEFADLGAVDA